MDLQTSVFDTVDHNFSLRKLGYYGIRGVANMLFEVCLSDRK